MKEYRDPLGRPIRRLYLRLDVLDKRCEGVIREFMERRSGGFRLPIPTDELVRLIEERTAKFDHYAQLPRVKISDQLYGAASDHLERTTLAHEFGHVWLHAPLWREAGRLKAGTAGPIWTCNREAIIDAPQRDWMEYQAGWVSGALLMPATELRARAAAVAARVNVQLPFLVSSKAGGQLIYLVAERCDVSQLAARIRLLKLGMLVEKG
jgi:Zn-dependent peptidase ImmA (M78 family)